MATSKSTGRTRIHTGAIEVIDYKWGQLFKGTRQELCAANLVEPSQFPGDPGNNKCSLRYQSAGSFVWISRISRDRFQVCRKYPNEAAKEAGLARIAEHERQINIRDHRARAKLPDLPRSYSSRVWERLQLRYPEITIEGVEIAPLGEGILQTVSFRGSASQLLAAGIVTQEMIDRSKGASRRTHHTPLGDGYYLYGGDDDLKVTIHYGTHPRAEPRVLSDAKRVLRNFLPKSMKKRVKI